MNRNHSKRNVHKPLLFVLLVIALVPPLHIVWSAPQHLERQTPVTKPGPGIRELGIKVGILPTGPLNAITDVGGVMVGQTTIIRGDDIRTGVTARYWFSLVMKAASNESAGIQRGKQTITEPSAVAPDAEVKLSIQSIAQLMANNTLASGATALGSVMVLPSSRS